MLGHDRRVRALEKNGSAPVLYAHCILASGEIYKLFASTQGRKTAGFEPLLDEVEELLVVRQETDTTLSRATAIPNADSHRARSDRQPR